jgi:D-proline reductase (dithiol) PrdB
LHFVVKTSTLFGVGAPIEYITRIRENYARLGYAPYTWVSHPDPPPWTEAVKPIADCRLGLIASGGIYVSGQVAFHWKDDTSFRAIPTDVRTEDLRANVVFPIDSLRALVAARTLGGLTDHAYTFMGGIYSARRVRDELAPRLTERLLADRADLALFVPV